MQIGVIVFDFEGKHYLETFEGLYFIPDSTIEAAWNAITKEPKHEHLHRENLSGRLARGIVAGEEIANLSYYINGREWPNRSVYLTG